MRNYDSKNCNGVVASAIKMPILSKFLTGTSVPPSMIALHLY
jgi:hypothetical protein